MFKKSLSYGLFAFAAMALYKVANQTFQFIFYSVMVIAIGVVLIMLSQAIKDVMTMDMHIKVLDMTLRNLGVHMTKFETHKATKEDEDGKVTILNQTTGEKEEFTIRKEDKHV